MTDEERSEADRLADHRFPDEPGINHLGTREVWKAGYLAACEAKHGDFAVTLEFIGQRWNAERARSQKLIDGLTIMAIGSSVEALRAKELLSEYEAGE